MPKKNEPASPAQPAATPAPLEPPPFEPLLDLIGDAERDQSPGAKRR